jgi:biopolymer transport protein TolR
MGMQIGKTRGTLSEINVTPLVDVMLVLLIIFMVTAPMMTRGIDIDLPKAKSGADETESRITVTIDADRRVFLNRSPVNLQLLATRIEPLAATGDAFVFLRADAAVPYGYVMEVIDQVKQAGVVRVGLVTRPAPEDSDRRQ